MSGVSESGIVRNRFLTGSDGLVLGPRQRGTASAALTITPELEARQHPRASKAEEETFEDESDRALRH
jgi:hypothetical protein